MTNVCLLMMQGCSTCSRCCADTDDEEEEEAEEPRHGTIPERYKPNKEDDGLPDNVNDMKEEKEEKKDEKTPEEKEGKGGEKEEPLQKIPPDILPSPSGKVLEGVNDLSFENKLREDEIKEEDATIVSKVFKYVRQNRLEGVKSELDPLPMNRRKYITSQQQVGNTMLSIAVRSNHVNLVQYLLEECGADVDQFDTSDVSPVTPLWLAVERRHLDAVCLLLQHGADVNAKGEGESPIVLLGAQNINLKIVEILISNGADVNAADEWGYMPLHAAMWNMDLMRLLLESGADMEAKDHNGNTILHLTVCKGFSEICKFLLTHGVSPYVRNNEGNDVFKLAALHREYEILIHLLVTFPYPKDAPKDFFDATTKARLVRNLEIYNPCDYSLDLHALLATEHILGPTSDKTFYALKEAAELTCMRHDFSQSWDIYVHILQINDQPLHLIDNNLIMGIFQLVYKVYYEHGRIVIPVERAFGIFHGMFRGITFEWDVLEKQGFSLGDDTEPSDLENLQKIFISLLNLLEFIVTLQQTEESTGNPSSPDPVVAVPSPCVLFERIIIEPKETDECQIPNRLYQSRPETDHNDNDQNAVRMRVHGRWEYMDVSLIEEDHYITTKSMCETTYHRLTHASRKLVPAKIPLPLQCLATQVIQTDKIPFQGLLPAALTNMILLH